jgi:hypothetical protein
MGFYNDNGTPHGDWIDYLIGFIPFVGIILWIIVIYAVVKLYRKLIKFLDKNS